MKKVIAIAAAMLAVWHGYAQTKGHDKKISYGFNFGINYSALPATVSDPVNVKRISTGNDMGFRLGVLADMPVSKHLSVIANSELSFYGNKLNILKADNSTELYEIPPMIELAAHLKYSPFNGSLKPYFLLGPAYKVPLVSETNKALQFTASVASVDVGIGFERKYAKFITGPEIRYSYGLSDIGTMPGIQNARLHTLSLIVKFRG